MNEKVREYREKLRRHPIIQDTLNLLKRDLPSNLHYHAFSHTEDVFDEAILFALTDNLPERDIELLAIAAACHDMGFVQSMVENEPIGAAFARQQMEKVGGYTTEEIGVVERMILDTTMVSTADGLKQVPTIPLSGYLLDADLSNLGRDDFFEKGQLLRKELGIEPEPFGKAAYSLVGNHAWHTPAAHALRQKKKEENIAALKAMIASS